MTRSPALSATATLAATVALAGGCAVFRDSPPLDVRYFTVDAPRTTSARLERSAAQPLALGQVRSSSFLRDRIVYRDKEELGAYEGLRWTEYPEVYLRRSLGRALFEDGRYVESLDPDAPTLDVELVDFEEVRGDGGRAGRIRIEARLRRGDRVLSNELVAVTRAAPDDGGIAPVVEALEAALAEAAGRIALLVGRALEAEPAPPSKT